MKPTDNNFSQSYDGQVQRPDFGAPSATLEPTVLSTPPAVISPSVPASQPTPQLVQPPANNSDLHFGGSVYTPTLETFSSDKEPVIQVPAVVTPPPISPLASRPSLDTTPATDTSLDEPYTNSSNTSSLESSSTGLTPVIGMTPVISSPHSLHTPQTESVTSMTKLPPLPVPLDTHSDRFSPFKYNRKALLITTTIVSLMLVVGLATYFFGSHATKSSTTSQNSSAISSQYAVGNLPLSSLAITSQLKVGAAEQLTINGQLVVNDTVVLAPGIAPTTPLTGQFYYNKTTNQPYYYNGTTFVSLQPTTATTTSTSPQSTTSTTTTTPTVTSLASSTGAITLGQGLSMTANQLDVATNLLNSLNATNLTTGTLPNTRLSPNVTMQGNTFNSPNQLVQLSSGGLLPTLDGSNLTNINLTNLSASNLTTGTLADARLTTNVTVQGNTFNSASQLVQLNASSQLPAVSGINLTNLNASNISSGTVADARLTTNVTLQGNTFNGLSQLVQTTAGGLLPTINGSNLTNLSTANLSGTIADGSLSSNVTVQGNTFNGASQLVQLNASSQLPAVSGVNLTNLNASNIASGTVADARLSTNVTAQGNTFNGIAQLVKTNASGEIPILSGINITNLNGSNINTGTVADSHLTPNVTVQGNTFNGASQLLQLTAGGILPALDGSNLANLNLSNLNASNITSGTLDTARLSTTVTVQGNTFNGANQLLQLTAGGIIPVIDGSNLNNLNASSVTSGTVVDARLSNNVTLQGNIFNGVSQLVQTTAGGILPVISGSNLTSINGSNITLGTVADARLSVNVAFLNAASQYLTGNLRIGTASSTSTSMLFVNGVIESWGGLKLPANASAPFTCIPAASGTISLTLFFVTCVCNGSSWVFTNDGSTSCNWLPVPLIPTIGTASDTPSGRAYNNGLATVYFTPSATGPAATSFTVTSSPGGYIGTGASSPITVAGLQSGVLYTFAVTATNVNGTSNSSAASNAITTTTVPQAPTIGSVTNVGSGRPYNNGLANITFTAGANGGSAVTSYTTVSSPGGYNTSGGSPISVTGLQSATAYTFTVTATNANGSVTSSASGSVTATTIPQAPTIGTATTTGNHTASVGYTPNGTGGLGVVYTASPGSGSGASPISVSGLAVATSYSFTVTATNSNGSATSGASNSITTTGSIVTGGTLANDGTYYYRTFTSSGTLAVSGSPLSISVLTVGGGGGGGGTNPGSGYGSEGGGGGGSTVLSSFSASSSYAVVVGPGGSGGNTSGGSGSPGTASTFNGANSGGGGNGGACCTLSNVTGGSGTYTGGSGGTGTLNYNTPGNGANGPSVSGFGFIAANFGGGGGGSGGAGGMTSGSSYIGSSGAGSYGHGGAAGNQLYGGGTGSTYPGSNGATGVAVVRYLMSTVD